MTSLWTLGIVSATAAAAHWVAAALPSPALGNLTASAILGWYAWHTASKTIPELVRNFREETAALRGEQAAERRAFHESLARGRDAQHADQQVLAAAINNLAERLNEAPRGNTHNS